MIQSFMGSRGFGNYGNVEYGFGQESMDWMSDPSGSGLMTGGADCGCPETPKTGKPGVCNPSMKGQSEMSSGITFDDKGCPVLRISSDGKTAEILVDEASAGPTAKQFIAQTRSQPDIEVVSHQSWFAALPITKKLAIAGMGFGALLVLIFAIKS